MSVAVARNGTAILVGVTLGVTLGGGLGGGLGIHTIYAVCGAAVLVVTLAACRAYHRRRPALGVPATKSQLAHDRQTRRLGLETANHNRWRD